MPWAVPSPVRKADTQGYEKARRKTVAEMHQRVRERLPHLPALADAAGRCLAETTALLAAAAGCEPDEVFDHAGTRYRRKALKSAGLSARHQGNPSVTAENLITGETVNLTRREDEAFWAWAIVETLRLSGVRLEELLEITHLALVSYRLPGSGEVVPLLQIVPSKSNEERLLLVDPELASVLATIITRLRAGNDGAVPLVARYDHHERTTGPLLPHLFQRALGARREVISPGTVYKLINTALAAAGLKDATGQPLAYQPHDFRRCFTTAAVTGGLPVHIAARILGHKSLTTTETYMAVFQDDLIRSYRAFLHKRRATRPAEEYREPTDQEWQEFQKHFQVRKVALGTCGRPYGASCQHEHACLTEMILSWDASLPGRLGVTHGQIGILAAHASRACRRAGAVRAVSGMSAHSVYRVITLQSVRCLSGVCQSACRLGAFVVGEESGPSRLSDLGLHREFRSASPDEPRGSYEPLMIGEEFPGRSGSSEAVDHCNPDVRVKAE